jgi:NADH-quinone oxidoreductase subunit L
MALIALTQYDIKRVVAYSTLSQLGYMTAALGASAYSAAIFHLMTHAFFKAVLFLAAGSVIIALHHEQDMRRMGGLKKYMPWTYWTLLVGAISSAGIPGFAGFYSKDAIIELVHHSTTPGATFRVPVRAVVRVRHGDVHVPAGVHGILGGGALRQGAPAARIAEGGDRAAGAARDSVDRRRLVVGPVVFGDYFGSSIVGPKPEEWHGLAAYTLHGLAALPFWLALAGIATATYLYLFRTDLPKKIAMAFGPLYALVERKVRLRRAVPVAVRGRRAGAGEGFWKGGDQRTIDGVLIKRLGAPRRLVLERRQPVPVGPDLQVRGV